MVHRSTPLSSVMRAYGGGGARALIDKIDDSPLMQAMTGQGAAGESFSASKDGSTKGPEAPQNYGFTSIVADATKGAGGMIQKCAEGFMSFLGGNRALPVCGMMDDRRHRLKNLGKDAAKGSSAMYGLKEWGQQFLNTEKGMYMTGNMEKLIRFALVQNQNGQTQQQQSNSATSGGGKTGNPLLLEPIKFRSKSGVEFEIEVLPRDLSVEARADGGGNGGGGSSSGGGGNEQAQSKSTGQKTLHKEDSSVWIEQNGTQTQNVHGEAYSTQKTGSDSTLHWEKDKKKSMQSTEKHTHIRFMEHRIWNEEEGNYWTSPCLVKKDLFCKEG